MPKTFRKRMCSKMYRACNKELTFRRVVNIRKNARKKLIHVYIHWKMITLRATGRVSAKLQLPAAVSPERIRMLAIL